jgi:hypothetical protein
MAFDVATPSTPRPSAHVKFETWPDRGDASVSVRAAWRHAEPVPAALSELDDVDEARHHEPTDTLLLRDYDTIVTALDMTRVRNGPLRQIVRDAVAEGVADDA